MAVGTTPDYSTVDVFVSYKREDRARVSPLVESLERAGLSVWWDPNIPGGTSWRQMLIRHLDSARCVVVVWSQGSVAAGGEFVQEEASRAAARRVLLPVRIDDVTEPLGFGHLQSLDLVDWDGRPDDPRVKSVLNAVEAIIAGRQPYDQTVPVVPKRRMIDLLLHGVSLLSSYYGDLLRLTTGPKRFFATLIAIHQGLWRTGLIFLTITLLIGEVAVIPLEPNSVSQRLAGVIFSFSYVLLYGYAAYCGWRVVGAIADVDRFFGIYFYVAGVIELIMKATFLIIVAVARVVDRAGWEQLTKALQSGDALNFFISAGGYFIERPVWQVVGVIAGCGYALVLMWMFTAWGAYRELTSLSRFRSGLAFMLFCMLSVPITIIMTMIAAALTSKLS